MSLFPAYTDLGQPSATADSKPERTEESWLTNESFVDKPFGSAAPIEIDNAGSDSANEEPNSKIPKKGRKSSPIPLEIKLDFDGSEQFYVDKKRERGYTKVATLHRPACPQYRTWKSLGRIPRPKKSSETFKRYFSRQFQKRFRSDAATGYSGSLNLSEEQFLESNKELNRSVSEQPWGVEKWLELVRLQDATPLKSITNTQLAERKMDILDKALLSNPNDDRLYALYVEVANRAFPSFEVSKIIEKLIGKAPINPVLWRGLILATQASMARCIVPDVLKLYERAMQNMYNKLRSDEIMLSLFRSCAYFMKQCGLYEQLFALIKLSLELNVNPERFNSIRPSEKDQELLIEFEEVVLSSGLPMNEIWLRIEKLRTNFYYLPCPQGFTCSDPQRMVFNEDVCFFIYPLIDRENSLKLVFIILRLLGVPLPVYGLTARGRDESECDSMEDLLYVFLAPNFCRNRAFDVVLWDLMKELTHGPSYFSSNIGYEIYVNTILEMLALLASCFTGVQRMVINIIWFRFERILAVINRLNAKLTEEAKKLIRGRMKKFLKAEENRNEVNYYVEYAFIEYELGNTDKAVTVLESTLAQGSQEMANKDKFSICSNLIELLLMENRAEEALAVVMCLDSTSPCLDEVKKAPPPDNRKLLVLTYLKQNLDNLSDIEMNVNVMEEEQLTLPDYFVNSIKCFVYGQLLIKSKADALKTCRILIKTFGCATNPRHSYIKERVFEMLFNLTDYGLIAGSQTLQWGDLSSALGQFSHNLFLNLKLANFKGQMWYKTKSLVINSHSSTSILFLLAQLRYKFAEAFQSNESDADTMAHKHRVQSLLELVVNRDDKLKNNALMWRLYLRIRFELENSRDQCKNVLFSALDECPWNKNLYLDGAVYVPQELTQIQDLIIEKQLRIYALPEELEILRRDEIQ